MEPYPYGSIYNCGYFGGDGCGDGYGLGNGFGDVFGFGEGYS